MGEEKNRSKLLYFIGGAAATTGVACLIYFCTQCGKIRGEKVIGLTEINGTKIKLIQQDRKWRVDSYKLEISDEKGFRAEFSVGNRIPDTVFYKQHTSKPGLETSLDSNDL